MAGISGIDITEYYHSKVHMAVLTRNYEFLNILLSGLPPISDPSGILAESDAIAEIELADARSSVIDDRDVPNRDTPLHLAVKLADVTSTFLLMEAGAEWSLQNEKGWTALDDAIYAKNEEIVKIMVRCIKPLRWAKWCRRIPLVVRDLKLIQDFYAEITFHFESTVVPFIRRMAPSDTMKIWKKGVNLRADTTLANFDMFTSKRSESSMYFLGNSGSFWIVSHKSKIVRNVFGRGGVPLSDERVDEEVCRLLKGNLYRTGIDVTKAFVVPSKKQKGKPEMVGSWKTSLYHMHDAVLSLKSRQVLGANVESVDMFSELNDLTEDELRQLNEVIETDSPSMTDDGLSDGQCTPREREKLLVHNGEDNSESIGRKQRRGWFDNLRMKYEARPKRSTSSSEDKEKEKNSESEYIMKFKPDLWLTTEFPLQIREILPLLDILGYKIKPVRRLKELLSTSIPAQNFPVKISFPVMPTIRLVVSFTKFELLPTSESEEFYTPPSTPPHSFDNEPLKTELSGALHQSVESDNLDSPRNYVEEGSQSPFTIPEDYVWFT